MSFSLEFIDNENWSEVTIAQLQDYSTEFKPPIIPLLEELHTKTLLTAVGDVVFADGFSPNQRRLDRMTRLGSLLWQTLAVASVKGVRLPEHIASVPLADETLQTRDYVGNFGLHTYFENLDAVQPPRIVPTIDASIIASLRVFAALYPKFPQVPSDEMSNTLLAHYNEIWAGEREMSTDNTLADLMLSVAQLKPVGKLKLPEGISKGPSLPAVVQLGYEAIIANNRNETRDAMMRRWHKTNDVTAFTRGMFGATWELYKMASKQ